MATDRYKRLAYMPRRPNALTLAAGKTRYRIRHGRTLADALASPDMPSEASRYRRQPGKVYEDRSVEGWPKGKKMPTQAFKNIRNER